ncbi:MAG: glycosyltransferase [Frankia sp.]|nr:glycosyltransferase [Frankia sp.]
MTVDRAGRQETGLERREFDQGQHDRVRDVLAVGTAGALVRRDVFDALDGLDRRLGLFRDDIDFGWRVNAAGYRVVVAPNARVRHARAAATGQRATDAVSGAPSAVDRRHAIAVLLANMSLPALLLGVPRLVVGALLRAVAFLLTRRPRDARDELAAIAWNALHVGSLASARARRRRERRVPHRALRRLFAGRAARLRGYADAITDWLTGGAAARTAVPGAGDDDDDALPEPMATRLLAVLRRPSLLLVLGLVVVTAAATRGLYGGGALVGSGSLPPPAGASDLWRGYLASWHAIGGGTAAPAAPSGGILALLSTVLLGKPWLAVDALALGAVPLAGLAAYLALNRTESRFVRVWAASTYALLPVATAAVHDVRLDVTATMIAAPLLVSAGRRVMTDDPRASGWRRPVAVGLVIAAAAAFAPQLLLLCPLALLGGVAVASVAGWAAAPWTRRVLGVFATMATSLAVLLPWSARLYGAPRVLLAGYRPDHVDGAVASGVDLLFSRPVADAAGWRWAMAGVVLAAFAGLLRGSGRAVAGWLLAALATALAITATRVATADGPGGAAVPVIFAALGFVVAAAVAARGARTRLARESFGWRQPAAAAVAGLALVAPVVLAVGWVRAGAIRDNGASRRHVGALPAFVTVQAQREPGLRVLWLGPGVSAGVVRYAVTPLSGAHFGDDELPPRAVSPAALDAVVSDLSAARGSDAAEALATYAVRYVAVPQPVPPPLAGALDVQPGLSRVAYVGSVQLWRVLEPTARVTLLAPMLATAARRGRAATRDVLRAAPPQPFPSGREGAQADIPPGPPGRLLVLADTANRRWVAARAGERLRPTVAWGWAQAFEVPADGGRVTVRRDARPRNGALAVQAVAIFAAVVIAAPSVRRSEAVEPVDDARPTIEEPSGESA